MSFKECVETNFEARKIGPDLRKVIIDKYQEAYEDATAKGLGGVEAELEAQKAADVFLKGVEDTSRNKVRSLIHQKKIDKLIEDLPENMSLEKKVSHILQNSAHRGEQIQENALRLLDDEASKLAPDFFETGRDNENFKQALKQVFNGDFSGPLGPLAKGIASVNEYLRSRFVSAGGIMGKVDGYTLPQVHRKDAFLKVRKKIMNEQGLNVNEADAILKQRWVDQVASGSDILDEAGKPLDMAKKKEVLAESYEDIMSDGLHSQRKKFEAGEELGLGVGDLDQRRNKRRVIHWKSFENWDAYNQEFGTGDDGLIQLFLDHTRNFSSDIGILESMGPRPTSMMRHLDNKMRLYGKSSLKRNWVNSQFRILKGIPVSGSVESAVWKALTGMQNFMRASMLGSASLSAVSDTAFAYSTAQFNGMSGTRVLKMYGREMFTGREISRVAKRAGFISNALNGSVLADSRFAGQMRREGATSWLAGTTNKLSGLNKMTETAKNAISLEFMGSLADFVEDGVRFKNLNKDFKAMIKKAGITESDWDNAVLRAEVVDTGEGKFVFVNELKTNPDLDSKLSFEVGNKLEDLMYGLRQQATNEATLATRAITTGAIFGDGSAGSLSKGLASSLFMFKTFPITVMMTHMVPSFQRANLDSAFSKAIGGDFKGAGGALKQGRFDQLAMNLVGTTMLGALAIHLKDLTKGKTTKDMNDPGFWQAAFLQGGGLGLFGDFFVGDYSRFGRSPITELGGPFAGVADDVFRATLGNVQRAVDDKDPNFRRDMFKILRRNIPAASLWYTRLAMDRMVLDRLEKMIDPDFEKRARKYEKRLKKETGQEFWWNPKDFTP